MAAICVLTNVQDNKIKGNIQFDIITRKKEKINENNNRYKGLKPGKHGFHIHSKGNLLEGCSSLCAHFNPDNTNHGDITDSKMNRHVLI